jgi:hypothetical protein
LLFCWLALLVQGLDIDQDGINSNVDNLQHKHLSLSL